MRIRGQIERVEEVAPFQGRFHTRSRRYGDGHLHVVSSQYIALCALGPPLACVVPDDTDTKKVARGASLRLARSKPFFPRARRRQQQQQQFKRGGEPPRMENIFVAYCTKVPVDLLAIVPEHCRRATAGKFPNYYTEGRRHDKLHGRASLSQAKTRLTLFHTIRRRCSGCKSGLPQGP